MAKGTIKNWHSGISNDEQEGFQDMKGLDIYSEKGVAQINKAPAAATFTADGDIRGFVEFGANLYLCTTDYGGASNSQLWKSTNQGATWGSAHTNANGGDCWDLIAYKGYMYYSSSKYIGRTADYAAFSDTFQDIDAITGVTQYDFPHFFKIYENRLYVTNGYQLLEWDNTVWTVVLTMPEEETLISIGVIGGDLALGSTTGKLYLWTIGDNSPNRMIETSLGPISALIEIDNRLFVFAGTYGVIYIYNGSDLEPYITIPNWEAIQGTSFENGSCIKQNSVSQYKNGIVFGANKSYIYLLSRNDDKTAYGLSKYGDQTFNITGSSSKIPIIFMQKAIQHTDWLIVGWGSDKIDIVNPTGNRYTFGTDINTCNAYIDFPVLDIGDAGGNELLISGVQCLLKGATTGDGAVVRVGYKLDGATSFTEIGTTITGANYTEVFNEIEKVGNTIEFRLALGNGSGNNCKLSQFKYF